MAQKYEWIPISEVRPYENNPRNNEAAVEKVAASIKEFGFQSPIIIDRDGVIIAGHTRLKAAEMLGLKEIPVLHADELTPEQAKAYRLADNKTGEFASWDFEKLEEELAEFENVDMAVFGFDEVEKEFDRWNKNRERFDASRQEGNEEYNEFLEKFEDKKTTDDCYTPDNIYEVVAEYVEKEFGKKRKSFVRPFYPGGDYQAETYKESDIVVDNPPFSIIGQIIDFYLDRNIKFFLFAPSTVTLNYLSRQNITAICAGARITYENGAQVFTNFLTNVAGAEIAAMSEPELWKKIDAANEENEKKLRRNIPKYDYPNEVVTSAKLAYLSAYDTKLIIKRSESMFVRTLDSMVDAGKEIFGGGLLISEKAAAEKAAAKKWKLSEREKEIIKNLGGIN